MAGAMVKRVLKIVAGCMLAVITGLVLLGLAKPDHSEIPEGAGGQMVTVDGVRLRYLQKGSGRDVLLIHGTPSSLEEWAPVFGRWSSKYRVTAYDRPGHGYSGPAAGETGIDYNAHMARRLMEELHLHDVLVVGHSYGGAVALKLAADDNSPATAFMIVASTVYPSDEPYAALGRLLRLPLVGRGVAVVLGRGVGRRRGAESGRDGVPSRRTHDSSWLHREEARDLAATQSDSHRGARDGHSHSSARRPGGALPEHQASGINRGGWKGPAAQGGRQPTFGR
jgi:pimeloyl-ACP methyl ester carboxylesterase